MSALAPPLCRLSTGGVDEDNPFRPSAVDEPPVGDDRNMAVLAHAATFGGYLIPFGNILGPLIVFLIRKDQSAYVRHHAAEALNFQITVTVLAIVFGILCLVLIGIPLLLGLLLFDLVVTIIAMIRASDGVWYRYPLCLRLVR